MMSLIKDLYNQDDAKITGAIIKKSAAKAFESKRNEGETCGVITFTIRDSKRDFVNCVVWGSEYFVRGYDTSFKTGDVGKLRVNYLNLLSRIVIISQFFSILSTHIFSSHNCFTNNNSTQSQCIRKSVQTHHQFTISANN